MAPIDVHSLTALDWFFVALTIISVMSAFRQGLVKVVFSLSGLIVGVIAATWVHSRVVDNLQTVGGIQPTSQVLGFLAVVGVIYVGFMVAGSYARKVAMGAGMEAADRVLGAGFGLVRGALTAAVVLVALMVALPRATWIERSQLAPYVLNGTRTVSFIIPDSFRDGIGPQKAPATGLIPSTSDALEARALKQR